LFGHLLDAAYVAPPNNNWLDDEAQPEVRPQPAVVAQNLGPQELIEDVIHQAGQPDIAAQVLHEVLIENDDATDPLLREIDQYQVLFISSLFNVHVIYKLLIIYYHSSCLGP
jgi:hypothetical protein